MASPQPVAPPGPVAAYLEAMRGSVLVLARHARAAGIDAPVPTCPDWTVRRLVGHLGAAHRRTTALLRAAAAGGTVELADLETDAWRKVAKSGRSSADPLDWLTSGAITLIAALARAGDDVVLPVVVPSDDGRPDRVTWARRMAHETTLHAIDALAAALGRPPTVAEARDGVPLDPALAADGIDELLIGFVPRSPLRSSDPMTLLVRATDVGTEWTVRIGPDQPPRTTVGAPDRAAEEAIVIEADAVSLHLGLWHRTALDAPLWPLWHDTAVQ